MELKTLDEIKQIWAGYRLLRNVDIMFNKVARRGIHVLEGKVQRAIDTNGKDNPLLEMITDRNDVMGTRHIHQGTDFADFFWNLFNWDYFQRQPAEKQVHLYRLAVAAGHFMEEDKMHPEMINAVRYANGQLER